MSVRNRRRAARQIARARKAVEHADWQSKPPEFWPAMAKAYNPTFDDAEAEKVGESLRKFWLMWSDPAHAIYDLNAPHESRSSCAEAPERSEA